MNNYFIVYQNEEHSEYFSKLSQARTYAKKHGGVIYHYQGEEGDEEQVFIGVVL